MVSLRSFQDKRRQSQRAAFASFQRYSPFLLLIVGGLLSFYLQQESIFDSAILQDMISMVEEHPPLSPLNCQEFLLADDAGATQFQAKVESGGKRFQISIHDPTKDCPVSSDIAKHGCYECHVLKAFLGAVTDQKVHGILDIGANIGLYGLSVAATGVPSFMVEPAKVNQQNICRTVINNEGVLSDTIKVFPMAAVATATPTSVIQLAGTQDVNKGGITTTTISGTVEGIEGVNYARAVSISTIRPHLPPAGSTIVLKVDVEGNECNALAGAMDYLRSVRLVYVAIEWSQERLQACQNRQAIFDLFTQNGLRPYQAMLDESTKPVGWNELDVKAWKSWIWKAPGRKRPERALFDVAWAKEKPSLIGPLVEKKPTC